MMAKSLQYKSFRLQVVRDDVFYALDLKGITEPSRFMATLSRFGGGFGSDLWIRIQLF